MTLEFDRIKLRNGRIYRFAGTVERVKTPSGVEVDDEGLISREDSQSDRTVKRTGLGAIAGGDGAVEDKPAARVPRPALPGFCGDRKQAGA